MKVVTFGELLLRLSPEGFARFLQADKFNAIYSGAEANVAISLSMMGIDCEFVTKLPAHEIGQAGINTLRRYGVGTENIARGGERVGIYFLETGASQRPGKVIYDRKHSSISTASAEDFDWGKIFDGADWFHFTGITPALSEELADICLDACKEAKKAGLKISCDLNYRATLWSKESAGKTMTKFMPYVDVCISNAPQILDVFGISGKDDEEVAKLTKEKFGFEKILFTSRKSHSASVNTIGGMLYDGKYYYSREYTIQIVDRIGAGDAFAGAMIYSILNGYDSQTTIEFGVAASCLKHTVEGDFNVCTKEEIESLVFGDGSGRVIR